MKISLHFIILLGLNFCFSQNEKDLLDKLKTTPSNQQAVVYNKLADLVNDNTKMYEYANLALSLSITHQQKEEEVKANYYIGIYYLSKSQYEQAQKSFEIVKQSIQNNNLTEKEEFQILLNKTTSNLGLVFMEQNEFFKALTQFELAKKGFENKGQENYVSSINNNIGVVYRSIGDNKKAMTYFEKVVGFLEKEPNTNLGYAYANLGRTHQALNDHEKAKIYYQKALTSFEKYPDQRGFGELHNYMAETALSNKDENIINYLSIAEKSFGEINYNFGLSDTYYIYAKHYFNNNDYANALSYAKKMLNLANELNAIETQANAHQILSNIYEKTNQTALAFSHLKDYNLYKSKLADVKTLRSNFENEKELALKAQQTTFELAKEKDFRNKLFWLFGLILVAGGLISYYIIQNHKKAKQTAELQKELADYEQKALHLQMNPHFVFNCLAAISSFIVQNSQQEAVKYLSKFSKLMRLTLDYSKTSLITIDKEIEGLTNYLELEKLRFQNIFNYNITKDSAIEDDCALPPMLLQPLVENAIIHGIVPNKNSKGQIDINFELLNDYLLITIQDNGIGYNESKKLKANSLGTHKSMALEIVAKRLEKMHHQATFEIVDLCENNQNGTKVNIKLPLLYVDLTPSPSPKERGARTT